MKTILLIEDDVDIRENTAEILELSKYNVLTAENGKVGVELAQKELPELIICDIMMPKLDGYGVLHILNRNPSTSQIPFMFLTAKSHRSDFRKGMNLGADDYLTKPFDDKDLLEAIEGRLKKSEWLKKEFRPNASELNKFIQGSKGLKALEKISRNGKMRHYKKKNNIYWEGDYANALLLVDSGRIKTYKTNNDGKSLITGIYDKGAFIGFNDLLTGSTHTESALAMKDSKVYAIPKEDFFELLYANRDVANKFIQIISNNLKEKEEQMLHLAYNSVRQRAAEALIILDKQKKKTEAGILIAREDLASIVGTAPESVIRTLSDFKEESLIAIKSNLISVLNSAKLNSVAFRGY